MPLPLTPEQSAILAYASTNPHSPLIIEALAGTGKTSTLIELLPLLKGEISIQAFNKSIVEELQKKCADLPFETRLSLSIQTVHALGLGILKKAGLSPRVAGGKLSFILRDILKMREDDDPLHRNMPLVRKLCGSMKASGFDLVACDGRAKYGSSQSYEDCLSLVEHFMLDMDLAEGMTTSQLIEDAQQLFRLSVANSSMIDFDDMIYLPLLHNLPVPPKDHVLIDEAQDINATRQELAFRCLRGQGTNNLTGRLIAVGDPNQAIYGFTGAGVESLSDIRTRASADTLPLTLCWRCAPRILEDAQAIVPAIRAGKPNLQGTVDYIPYVPPLQSGATKDETPDFFTLPQPGDAILCRLNRPLLATALQLLRRGKRAKIEGKDLGTRLLQHLKSAASNYLFQPLPLTLSDLAIYREEQVSQLLLKKREAAAALLEDEIDAAEMLCLAALEADPQAGFPAVETLTNNLFDDNLPPSQFIILSSIHKAKGREWPHVYLLGRADYMPFHLAKADWELQQEQNLIYVAITRAETHLTYVTGVQSALDKLQHRQTLEAN